MEKKLNKEERIKAKEKQSAAVTGKMSVVFIALVAALTALIYCGGKYPTQPLVLTFNIATAVTALLTVAALVRYILSLRSSNNYDFKVFSPMFTLGLAAAAFFMFAMFPAMDATYTMLALIAFAVLFFVYEIYPVDFFICTACVFSGCIGAAVFGRTSLALDIVVVLVHLAVVALCLAVTFRLSKNGTFKLGKKKLKKPYGMIHAAVYACAAASLVALFGVLCFGYLLYFVAAACAVYFIVAIIYTVKLM